MIEEQVTVTVVRAVITGLPEARELQDWCEKQPGLYCRITSQIKGGYEMRVGGETADERAVEFGDTVTWDGSQFAVTKPGA